MAFELHRRTVDIGSVGRRTRTRDVSRRLRAPLSVAGFDGSDRRAPRLASAGGAVWKYSGGSACDRAGHDAALTSCARAYLPYPSSEGFRRSERLDLSDSPELGS